MNNTNRVVREGNEDFVVPADVIQQYDDEGACRVPNAFSRDWVEQLLNAYDDVVAELKSMGSAEQGSSSTFESPNQEGMPPTTFIDDGGGAERLKHVVWHDQRCSDWLYKSPAASIVGQVIGAQHLRFYWDQYFVKTGGEESGATPWHHDIAAFSFYGMHLPSFWIALTDIDEDNAPLITAVGSNKRTHVMYRGLAGVDNVPLPKGYAERDEMIEWVHRDGGEVRTWTAKAGDALLIHPYTYHASLPRKPGSGRRVAYTSRWLGDDVVWWKREMTFNYPDDKRFDDVKQGEPPPDSGFPILWRKPAGS